MQQDKKGECSSGHLLLLWGDAASSATCSTELQSHYGADTGRPRSRMPYRPRSLISFFLTREPPSAAASRPCLLQFSPPRPRINSEPSHLQEDCKPPLEVNPFSQATLQKIGKDKETERRSRKVRERSASAPTTSSPALALIPCGKDCGLIVGRPGR